MSAFNKTAEDRERGERGGELAMAEWTSTGEGGAAELIFEIPEGQGSLAIMLEGDIEGTHVRPDAVDGTAWDVLAPDSGKGRLQLLTASTQVLGRIKTLRIRITARIKAKIKVTVAYLSKVLKRGWNKLSCKMCKRLMKLLILALLAGFNLPIPATPDHDDLPAEVWSSLVKYIEDAWHHLPAGVQELFSGLDSNFLQKFIAALKWTINSLGFVAAIIDKVLAYLCQKLGFCVPAATNPA